MKGERKTMSIHHEIHQLRFIKSQIERKVGMNRDMVRKYCVKDFEEMSQKNIYYTELIKEIKS